MGWEAVLDFHAPKSMYIIVKPIEVRKNVMIKIDDKVKIVSIKCIRPPGPNGFTGYD